MGLPYEATGATSGSFSLTWRTDKERDRGQRRPESMELKNRRYGMAAGGDRERRRWTGVIAKGGKEVD
jgi:hypothetical protein